VRTIIYFLSGVLLALTAALIIEGAFSLHLIPAWLISINFFTAIYYWIDKINAVWVDEDKKREAEKVRIPEMSLLGLALVGGSPLAVPMILFLPHKLYKPWFMVRFLAILALQGAALYLFWEQLPWP
jgi:uncharacterized membrane protein YsdA (DUF1294 family)